jgi:thiamine biosynthesis lipoprotein
VATYRTEALGTEVTLVVSVPPLLPEAQAMLLEELDATNRAYSRFRNDAELNRLYEHPGQWVEVSERLLGALVVARWAAEKTDGAVDPTVGNAVAYLGYDRDFASVSRVGPPLQVGGPVPGWRTLELDHDGRRARLAPGVHLDLGATGKALAADRAASRIAKSGTGVVVSLGGDVALAGPAPRGGWHVGVGASSGDWTATADQVITLESGGVATSSTALRTWRRGEKVLHHIIDPRTGDSAPRFWDWVTVAAWSCVEANAVSTACVVWGGDAPDRLTDMGLPARLVRHGGEVVTTPGWPSDAAAPAAARGEQLGFAP